MNNIELITEVSKTEEFIKQKDKTYKKVPDKTTESSKTIITSNKKEIDQILFDEWKECRSAIAKYGEFVHSIRKYGFTIITGLLTANAYLFIKFEGFQPIERLLLSSSLSILIFGLFITDMYYLVLIRASVYRAIEIEYKTNSSYTNGIKLTATIHHKANQTYIDTFSILVYISFIFISMLPSLFMGQLIFGFTILILSLSIGMIILLYINFIWTNEPEIKKLVRKVIEHKTIRR
jgi:hypothetical protein